jgi:hypothetical protein
MFKFKLGQTVWYMKDNNVHSAPIGARTLTEVDETFRNTRAGNDWNPRILYGTVHGSWREDILFASFDDLSSHLKNNSVVG